jgi:hypothetical protein
MFNLNANMITLFVRYCDIDVTTQISWILVVMLTLHDVNEKNAFRDDLE